MKGLILNAESKSAKVQQIPKPSPATGEILVRVHAIALNPIDPLYVHNPLGKTGRTVGSDFSGVIEAAGNDTPASIQLGQRVAGFLQGACSVNERPGAFAEYLVVPWDLVWFPADGLPLVDAAGVSLVGLTAAQAIFQRLGLPAPFKWNIASNAESHTVVTDVVDEHKQEVNASFFIYGASTSVALLAAQFIRASDKVTGKKTFLMGAASTSKYELLRKEPYLYDYLVDYRDDQWPLKVCNESPRKQGVDFAYDCISEGDSVSKVDSTLASNGKLAIVRSRAGRAWSGDDLSSEPIYGAVWEGLGVEVQYQGFTVKESPEARQFAVAFYRWLSGKHEIEPVTTRLMPGGLESIVDDGFVLLGPGSMEARMTKRSEEWMKPVSAEKLVYVIDPGEEGQI